MAAYSASAPLDGQFSLRGVAVHPGRVHGRHPGGGGDKLTLAYGPAVILELLGAGVDLIPKGQHPVVPDFERIGTEPDAPSGVT